VLLARVFPAEFTFVALCRDPHEVEVIDSAIRAWNSSKGVYDEEWDLTLRNSPEVAPQTEHIRFLFDVRYRRVVHIDALLPCFLGSCVPLDRALQAYRPQFWFYEVVEVTKKVLLSCIVLLFMPETPSQLLFCTVVTIFYAVLKLKLVPFTDEDSNRCCSSVP
jgi:hypothetical protein